MKSPLFIDTGYLLALVNTSDTFHQRALAAMNQVQPPFVTTEAVLTEVGNALARQRWRSLGVSVIQRLQSDPDLEIVTVTPGVV